jgi:hypothetical protein
MNGSRVSLIWEYNAYLGEPKGTIWVLKGDFNHELELSEAGARRVIGPIDCELSAKLHEALAETLRWLGHDVIVHAIADD